MFGNSNIVGILQGYVPCCSVLFYLFYQSTIEVKLVACDYHGYRSGGNLHKIVFISAPLFQHRISRSNTYHYTSSRKEKRTNSGV